MNGWRVGVSAIGLPLAEVVARGSDRVDAALAHWRESRGLDFLIVMSSHASGGAFQRELGTNAQGDAAVALLPRLVRLPAAFARRRCGVSPRSRRAPGDRAGVVAADAGAAASASARLARAGRGAGAARRQGLPQGGAAAARAVLRRKRKVRPCIQAHSVAIRFPLSPSLWSLLRGRRSRRAPLLLWRRASLPAAEQVAQHVRLSAPPV